ncbi:MAG: D-TA family PLP-dependent enzyme [Bacteroidetes bacterium]|jgi:D-serine deaminase-like pyridoxal phosphate-dependent protein|nr:MAG: D-TA family PLP-dependent enzyme [Bacteroidota bacterium]
MNWYEIQNIDEIDSPALLLYKERVQQNILAAVEMIKDVRRLRPHVKTNKIAEVCKMMLAAGITKFKCATIAEAEMLGMVQAKEVLLAYQPVGPKAKRLLSLVQTYPATTFSCLVDNFSAAKNLSDVFSSAGKTVAVFIDLNTGMNRSGIVPSKALELFHQMQTLSSLTVVGLHGYDGHVTASDLQQRRQASDNAFKQVETLIGQIEKISNKPLTIVAGGSPTFPVHVKRNIECSPGTFVFWDWNYKTNYPDQPFEYAALVLTRIISIVDATTITTDLGHKSVAAENPQPRVHFLNASDAVPMGQSEEHLVLKVPDSAVYNVGDVLYGVPIHICPTVALYDKAIVVENNKALSSWKVIARDRSIMI